jgi:hypothetical protein
VKDEGSTTMLVMIEVKMGVSKKTAKEGVLVLDVV